MKWLSLTLACSTLFAEDNPEQLDCLEYRVSMLEACTYDCIVNPPARPYPVECYGLYTAIDPFLWQAHAGGLGIAIKTENNQDLFSGLGKSKVENLNFDWDWGFRLGVGLHLDHDGWDLLARWTYWKTDGRKSGSGEQFYPNWGAPALLEGLTFQEFDSSWSLALDFLDLEMGRSFYVSRFLVLRPIAGLRTAWLWQDFDITYNDPLRFEVEQSSRYWGIGIRGGVEMEWGFGGGWSIFSQYTANLLYNYFSVKHEEKEESAMTLDTSNFSHIGTAITDMQLGIRLSLCFTCSCITHLELDFGWENHYLPSHERFLHFVDNGMGGKFVDDIGDLAIQGYFLRLRIDF